MNSMVSLYIDDELSLEEKSEFIERIHKDSSYYVETKELLDQERLIRSDMLEFEPETKFSIPFQWSGIIRFLWRPIGFAAVAAACAILVMAVHTPQRHDQKVNRFVIYRPDVSRVEITGSFTGWQRVPLQMVGNSGYWEVSLKLSKGEHRFTYILDGDQPYADPTILSVENDDFGGMNSIIKVESKS